MEDTEQPPAPIMEASAPQVVERPLWVLNRDEQRLLIITFVGGLASIVAGACVIGGAIALARFERPDHSFLGLMLLSTALCVVDMAWSVILFRRSQGPRPILLLNVWLSFSLISVLLLIWIGLAAGIH